MNKYGILDRETQSLGYDEEMEISFDNTTLLSALFDLKGEWELIQNHEKDPVQSLFCIRTKRRALRLSDHLLDNEGRLQKLEETIGLLEKEGSLSMPGGYSDADLHGHFLRTLLALKENPELRGLLHSFSLPLCDPSLEEMISFTLDIEGPVGERDLISAILSAMLCSLRQSVGSCFATAPAILVHEQYIFSFLEDMQSLLFTGKLQRTFGGVEFSIPISPSPGLGDLKNL